MSTARAGSKGVPRPHREAQILTEATREFGTRGYAAVSMNDIAERVGVTKPLLYHYFGSKDGLYLACLARIAEPLTESIAAAMAPGALDPGTPLSVLAAIFTTLEGRRHAWSVLYDPTLPGTGAAAEAALRHRSVIDRLAAGATAELLRARGCHDPLDAAALKQMWIGVVSSLVGWWIRHPEVPAPEMARRCERIFTAIQATGNDPRSA